MPPSRRHCTVLLRLDSALCLSVLREVAENTRPFDVVVERVVLSRVDRLSEEFKQEVFAVGLTLRSPELVEFRRRYLVELKARVRRESVATNPADAKHDDKSTIEALTRVHDPYNDPHGGHSTLGYVSCPAPDATIHRVVAAANKQLQANPGTQRFRVTALSLKLSKGRTHTIELGNHFPLLLRAVTVPMLETFMSTIVDDIAGNATTSDVVQRFIVPSTKECACSFVQAHVERNEQQARAVGHADIFVSHAWSYKFVDLIATLQEHRRRRFAINPNMPEPHYWIDIFAVNQHNLFGSSELPMLKDVIAASKEVLVTLSPWDHPVALTRIWCLFEILTAMTSDTPITVELPPNDVAAFDAALSDDFSNIRSSLCHIDSANAQATNPIDLQRIREQIKSTVGFTALNTLVKDRLRAWLLETVDSRLSDRLRHMPSPHSEVNTVSAQASPAPPNDACDTDRLTANSRAKLRDSDWLHSVAGFLGEFGKLDRAAALYDAVLQIRLQILGEHHAATISAANDLGFLLPKVQRAQDAVSLLQRQSELLSEQIDALRAVRAQQTPSENKPQQRFHSGRHVSTQFGAPTASPHATVSTSLLTRRSLCDSEESLTVDQELQRLRRVRDLVRNNTAMALGMVDGQQEAALQLYQQVLESRHTCFGGQDHPDSIATTNNMAWLLARMGRQREAEGLFRKVFAFRRSARGFADPSTLNAGQNLSETIMRSGSDRMVEAKQLLEQVVAGKVENMGVANSSTLKAIAALVECLVRCGEKAAAKSWFQRVQQVPHIPRGVIRRLARAGFDVNEAAEQSPQ